MAVQHPLHMASWSRSPHGIVLTMSDASDRRDYICDFVMATGVMPTYLLVTCSGHIVEGRDLTYMDLVPHKLACVNNMGTVT